MGVPKSLCENFGSTAVRRSVDKLIEILDGKNTPELEWTEARSYNKALLSGAQVRAEYVEFLFEVWERSLGIIYESHQPARGTT